MSVWKQSTRVASKGMFFADQGSQCAEEGAGLGWFECHFLCCGGFLLEWRCGVFVQRT
jgi:hypothetical protein